MIGIGVGIGRQRFASGIFSAYAARVAADGGVTEAGACVDAVSALLQTASLLLIPSGYKSGKVYSEIPTNGDGDLTFTRASSATRVNSAGLIEKVRTNLLAYSEQFDNAYYGKVLGTATANAGIAPDGTLTADLFTKTSAINTVSEVQKGSIYAITGAHSFSVYFKQSVGNGVLFRMDASGNTANVSFVFSTKVSTQGGANILSHSIEELANGWFRLKMSANVISTSWVVSICNLFGNPTNDAVLIWGAQLETGDIATDYIPTTTAAVSVGITANVPRLDYSQGSCPSLLLEPQRTNLLLRSEEFDNFAWTKTLTTVTANAATSPSGFMDADRIQGVGISAVIQNINMINGTTYTISVWIKSAGTAKDSLRLMQQTNRSLNVTATNEWVRYQFTFTNTYATSLQSNGIIRDAANNDFDVYVWGFQLEVGSNATSYIPTLGTSVTRVADVANKTGISSLIGQSEGVLFWEGIALQLTDIVAINRSTTNGIYINKGSGNLFRAAIYNSSNVIQFADTIVRNTNTKIAIAYKSGDSALFINGAKIGSTNTSSITFNGALSEIRLNDNYLIETAPQFSKNIAVYNQRLTDSELIALTTL